MRIQDHYLRQEPDGRYFGTIVVNGSKIESPRFHDKDQAEKWLLIQCQEYRQAKTV